MIGKQLGKLIVVEKLPRSGLKKSFSRWKCICECGNETIVDIRNFKRQKSCGCSHLGHSKARKEYGEASFNRVYHQYQYRAHQKGLEFKLTKEQFKSLTKQNCHYCGERPSQISIKPTFYGEYVYNGIDRINSDIGYVLENCVTCCGSCNFMKKDQNKDDFLNRIKLIYERNFI